MAHDCQSCSWGAGVVQPSGPSATRDALLEERRIRNTAAPKHSRQSGTRTEEKKEPNSPTATGKRFLDGPTPAVAAVHQAVNLRLMSALYRLMCMRLTQELGLLPASFAERVSLNPKP